MAADRPSRAAIGMFLAVSWALCAAFWLALDDTTKLPELIDGAVAATIGESMRPRAVGELRRAVGELLIWPKTASEGRLGSAHGWSRILKALSSLAWKVR